MTEGPRQTLLFFDRVLTLEEVRLLARDPDGWMHVVTVGPKPTRVWVDGVEALAEMGVSDG